MSRVERLDDPAMLRLRSGPTSRDRAVSAPPSSPLSPSRAFPGARLVGGPRTPFDPSAASAVASGYVLLPAAAAAIPRGPSVVVRAEPRDPIARRTSTASRSRCCRAAARCRPAFYGAFRAAEFRRDAEYVVVVGPGPRRRPGRLLLDTPEGSVWRRARR